MMQLFFFGELVLSPAEISLVVITSIGFLVMFGLSSLKGDYQSLVDTTLANDELNRKKYRESRKSK